MATNVVTWFRHYLAARDLGTEVAGGLVVEGGEVEHSAQSTVPMDVNHSAQTTAHMDAGHLGQASAHLLDANHSTQSTVRMDADHSGKASTPFLDADHLVQTTARVDSIDVVEASARLDVDHLTAQPMVLERVPAPLPTRVRQIAVISLIVFGVLCTAGTLFVVGGAIAVVLMPILMGREGVGTAMITLFTVCVTAVVSGILLLAARSAARVIRREQRGVRSLYVFSLSGLIVAALAGAMAYWLRLAFFGGDSAGESNRYILAAVTAVPLIFMAWFARATFVLRQFTRDRRNGGTSA